MGNLIYFSLGLPPFLKYINLKCVVEEGAGAENTLF